MRLLAVGLMLAGSAALVWIYRSVKRESDLSYRWRLEQDRAHYRRGYEGVAWKWPVKR